MEKIPQGNRPRRPDPNTLSYLRSLPLDEGTVHDDVREYVEHRMKLKQKKLLDQDENGESQDILAVSYPQSLSAALSAIHEIRNEVASLAGDEFGSQCIETLSRIGAAYSELAARKLLYAIQGYLIHLSMHRFGSHVIQTLLQVAVQGSTNTIDQSNIRSFLELEEDDDEEGEDVVPSMKEILVSFVDELAPYARDLAFHICGSHVLRSLLCILGGVEIVDPYQTSTDLRRGKLKTKPKGKTGYNIDRIGHSENNALSGNSVFEMQYVKNCRLDVDDEEIKGCLSAFLKQLVGSDELRPGDDSGVDAPGDLQIMACDPCAGPVLSILIRVWTYCDAKRQGDKMDSKSGLVKLEGNVDPKPTVVTRTLRTMRCEPRFQKDSVAESLAMRILCWDCSEANPMTQKFAGDVIYGLSGESRGSHLLETILRHCHDDFYDSICRAGGFFQSDLLGEYIRHDVSNFVIQTLLTTLRTRQQVELFVNSIEPTVNSGYLLDASMKRRNIFWRLVEVSAKHRVGHEVIISSMRKGFSQLVQGSGTLNTDMIDIKDCIPKLLLYEASKIDGDRINLDPSGTRAFYHLLHFSHRLCEELILGFFAVYSAQDIESMACDALGSVCILDGILDSPKLQSHKDPAKILLEKLKGRWLTLALHRVGHHIVKKLFFALSVLDDKASLSAELAKGIAQLNRKSFGKLIIVDCAVKDALESESALKIAIKKLMTRQTLIQDLELEPKKRKRKH